MTEFDPEAAHAAITNGAAITNRDERRLLVATQTALALADIAASLRVLADAERFSLAELGVVQYPDTLDPVDAIEAQAIEPVDLTDAEAGTRVRLIQPGAPDPGREGELTGSGGIDQGIPWVGVRWATGDGFEPAEARVFVPHLEAVHAPTVASPWGRHEAERLGEPAAPVDDLDTDFDGDPMPVKTADAIDALKAAKKKGKGKR